ncbi:MAG: peptidylprolyl isomerase [Chitinispirillia bacterium]|nr:peptidylprolyl isomerase [Chitinispirillia bacterium]MCL2268792.1 peptidylprolyl isomerase [Chitinispirillia bacterium]
MIQKLREMAPGLMIVIIVAFVGGTIFLDWGMNVTGQGRATSAGKINGKDVSFEHFNRLVDMERMRQQEMGRDIPPQQSRMIPAQVWNREVNRVLLDKVVKDMRLESSPEAVFEYLRRNPAVLGLDTASVFMTNGVFDTTKYAQWLNEPRTWALPLMRDVEYQIKYQELPAQKLDALLKAGVFVSPAEVAYEFRQRNDKATFEYFKVADRNFRSDDTSAITDKMISDFYAANQRLFHRDEQADLYFVKIPKIATKADVDFNRAALGAMKRKIEVGELTFEEAAFESDDEGTAQNGGDLGWFGRGMMVAEFEATAFSIDTGVISDPVKTMFGHHIIKVYDQERDTAGTIVRVRARHILIKDNPTNETLDMLSAKADDLRRAIVSNGFEAAASGDPTIIFDSTGLFRRVDNVPKIGYIYGVNSFAFSNRKPGEVSDVIDDQNAFYIFGVKQKTKRGLQSLAVVRPYIVNALKDTLASQGAKSYAQSILERVKGGATVDDIKDGSVNVAAGLAEDVAAGGYVPQLGGPLRAANVALKLSEGQVSNIIRESDGFSIVRVTRKNEPVAYDPENQQARQAAEMAKMQGQQSAYVEWFRSLHSGAKIVNNVERIYLD